MKIYGFKIEDVLSFIDPQKVIEVGQEYVLNKGDWNVMTKRSDESRYKDFWEPELVSKIIVGLVVDEIYDGHDLVEGELRDNKTLIVYPKNMSVFSEAVKIYLENTPDINSFVEKTTDVLELVSKSARNPDLKDTYFKNVEYGFYEVQ